MHAKIYVTHHKKTHLIRNSILEPIQVGSGADLDECQHRDNTGDNISERNDRYCELTAAYWAWKNGCNADHVGLMHYRRFLDFKENRFRLDAWGVENWPSFTSDFTSRFGLDSHSIAKAIGNHDILLPRPWSVRNAGFRTLYEHYGKARHHHEADLIRCRNQIAKICPEYLLSWDAVLRSEHGWFNNIFLFRADLYDQYCGWLFPLLQEVEKEIPLHTYGTQERRVLGYLAERLLNVWVKRHIHQHPHTSIREFDRVFISDPSPRVWDPAPRFIASGNGEKPSRTISVVVASDNGYVPHLGALIASVCDNIARDVFLDLLILDGGISPANQAMLERLVPGTASINFIGMQDEFAAYFTHMHFSRATFFRLVLDRILVSREKVIYIDCDTIVLGDLGEIWGLDMEDKPIAAVHDYIMESFCRGKVLSADFTGSLPARTYLQTYVGIADEDCDNYFQAGLLVMNLRRIRELNITQQMTDALQTRKYWFLDQDVLNKFFCGSHLSLPAEWNVVNMVDEISKDLEEHRVKELQKAREQAKLIHFAGYEAKPWINSSAPLGSYYFYYLRRTFWYEDVMGVGPLPADAGRAGERRAKRRERWKTTLRRLWRSMPIRVRQIGNPMAYSLRRRLLGGKRDSLP
jgi:lipopolysaccharide biosynthesis glycosyltransferase